MKNIFLSLLTIFAVVGTATAQDAPVNRSLSFYLDGYSGDIAQKSGYDAETGQSRLFDGNEIEFGMRYSQNFATVPWLSMWVKTLMIMQSTPKYGTGADNMNDYLGNRGYFIGAPRVQVGVNFGGYSILALDTRGILANCNFYSVVLPNNAGKLTFLTILEFWAVPNVVSTGTGDTQIMDLFALRADYTIAFAQNWSYTTKLALRFAGGGNEDSAAAFFVDGFNIRWENKVAWNITPSFGLWAQLRYRIDNITHRDQVANKIDHRLMLQGGISYAFDFSNN